MDKNTFVKESSFHQHFSLLTQSQGQGNINPDNNSWGVIDLNEALVKNKQTTFFLRVNCNAVKDAGIQKGDVVIVDRALAAGDGKVVIAVIGGELLIRKLMVIEKRMHLIGDKLAPLVLSQGDACIWGVVTYVIHSV
ncbi:LexA family protein [Flavisolibacter ginsengisoli]|uniref:DNA polymerase V n=1 Tax=Flavisolibacter ginsengisoli DSM 18119 TaxID=1121884 RepID=A0A1M5G197_9BACT|nr:S24 family peptidase [Flavisolibacter ginsengisoli]SHF97489.1 DNA polymerase V [Flavisolibacter ginsengisoli DSM 18119]